jgi:hypothetical protein
VIARRSFETTAIRMRTMTERPLQRDAVIREVRRTLDEQCTCSRGEDQERILRNSVCPHIIYYSNRRIERTAAPPSKLDSVSVAHPRAVVGGDHRCAGVCVAEKFLDRVNIPPARLGRIPFDCMPHPDFLEATVPSAAGLRHPGLRVSERTPLATGDPG